MNYRRKERIQMKFKKEEKIKKEFIKMVDSQGLWFSIIELILHDGLELKEMEDIQEVLQGAINNKKTKTKN